MVLTIPQPMSSEPDGLMSPDISLPGQQGIPAPGVLMNMTVMIMMGTGSLTGGCDPGIVCRLSR